MGTATTTTRVNTRSQRQASTSEEIVDIEGAEPNDGDDPKENNDGGYSWEEEYKRSWDVLQEDEDGSLRHTITSIQNQKRKRQGD